MELKGGGFTASREKFKDKNEAQAISAACNGKPAKITKITKQNKSVSSPKLYDLPTLQREANKLFGYTASETLALAQSLYEKKLITYPRTDSRYITEDMAHGIDDLVTIAGNVVIDGIKAFIKEFALNAKAIVNNNKVTDHHAILPTAQMSKNFDSLTEQERNILLMICVRLISTVSEKHTFIKIIDFICLNYQ